MREIGFHLSKVFGIQDVSLTQNKTHSYHSTVTTSMKNVGYGARWSGYLAVRVSMSCCTFYHSSWILTNTLRVHNTGNNVLNTFT